MHIWAGKVLWRVERVEFRTSSPVSPVIYLVRLAPKTVGYSWACTTCTWIYSAELAGKEGASRRAELSWEITCIWILSLSFPYFANQSTSFRSKKVRAWYLPSLEAGVVSYSYIFVLKKTTLNPFLNMYNSLTAQMYMFVHLYYKVWCVCVCLFVDTSMSG